jgi:hypothetical protein
VSVHDDACAELLRDWVSAQAKLIGEFSGNTTAEYRRLLARGQAPVDCTHGVVLLGNAAASCITPSEANSILAGAGQSQRIDVGPDGRAFIVWPTLW